MGGHPSCVEEGRVSRKLSAAKLTSKKPKPSKAGSAEHVFEKRIWMVRHGQYDESPENGYDLTALGREQAHRVGEALLGANIDAVFSSTMARAKTTAKLMVNARPVKAVRGLSECLPTAVPGYPVAASEARENRKRLDRAFAQFFSAPKKNRTDLLVCHGNVIRYFVCKALGIPVETWIRLAIHHCSITEFRVRSNGKVYLISYNETRHLPPGMRTTSHAAKALQRSS